MENPNRLPAEFCPHEPHPKQELFLQIDDRESLFGGAAGGGKSDALLMKALQHVKWPHYRALILRRQSVDLERSEAILDRAQEWWLPTSRTGVVYHAQKKSFTFPSGARIEFGHMQNVLDKLNYQGGAWHFIAFDELTQFTLEQYLYMFSRNRRNKDDKGKPAIPLRICAASNPGGPSHTDMKDRFMSDQYARDFLEGTSAEAYKQKITYDDGTHGWRWFVPSLIADNPSLDATEYIHSLEELDVITKAQLMSGNWVISPSGLFKADWFKVRYRLGDAGHYHMLRPDGTQFKVINPDTECTRFLTIDPAGTSADIESEKAGRKEPSHSVISTWDLTREGGMLIWRSVKRLQAEFPIVLAAIKEVWREQGKPAIWIEYDGIGRTYYDQLQADNYSVFALHTQGKDKATRAATATNEAAEGNIFLPQSSSWLSKLESELFQWQGTKQETADQIDTLAYAAKLKQSGQVSGNTWGGGF